ncbi:uncharacterized protein [Leptinotarsa decemlineata]|uniref:uncharacterized protein n=1 Tax=Leptinotarsa decemlineata TaxID=7539 RepID=UPI003D308F77
MDSALSLECPLCCEEKFSSHHSLKYHILSIIDNLLCPACNTRFDDILNLVEHLGRECRENDTNTEIIKKEYLESSCSPISKNGDLGQNSTKCLENEESESNDIEDGNLMYMCVMCNIQFTSMEEHVDKFHSGEEVILETEETESIENCQVEYESMSQDETEIYDGSIDNEYISSNDIDEQQCPVKGGRMVRADESWNNEDISEEGPMTENYTFENGQARKVSGEEAEQIKNKNSLVQIYQCPKCCLKFPEVDHFMKHLCDPSKISHKLKCIHCNAVFSNDQSLHAHMESHSYKEKEEMVTNVVTLSPHTCNICKTMFPSFKSLRLHQKMHDPVKEKALEAPVSYSSGVECDSKPVVRQIFVCSICNNTYDKEYEEVHMKSHEEGNQFDCTICNRKFHSQENLEMHTKVHYNTKKVFTCSYCKKAFNTEEALQDHVATLCQPRQYVCRYCGRRFARPHEKVKHERIHTGEKPHVCQICGKSFRVSYCLTLHLRTHSGTRPYKCPHCDKRFKSHSVYNHHMLTHSDVRAYKCTYCPKAFKTSVQLAGHKNSHIKPFPCTECNRPFASLYAVRTHMETHKRENNLKFDCWLCGATYARAFALRDHVRNHHTDENVVINDNVNDPDHAETQESTSQIQNEMEHSE